MYRTSDHNDSGLTPAEWRSLRSEVLRRDKFTCLRCDKKFRNKKDISVHHIVPRRDGGSNDLTNLVALCNPCHDHVEIYGYPTRAEIIGSYEKDADPSIQTFKQGEIDDDEPDPYNRPEWHKYVYGGMRRRKR